MAITRICMTTTARYPTHVPFTGALFLGLVLCLASSAAAHAQTTREWRYVPNPAGGACTLGLREVPLRAPDAGEIQVRIWASSFNGRDRYRLAGSCDDVQVPLSDGAGEVTAVGAGVTRFEVGDRVVTTFFAEGWIDGNQPPDANPYRRGGPGPGVLTEGLVGDADGFVAVPEYLTYEEASTLTIAALTAYNALFKYGDLQPNDYVLLEGTGGVSSFGLLFAAAAGARPVITSSSDEKLARAVELGAVGTVNYRRNPEWQEQVLEITGGIGVKHVLEIGGRETLPRALQVLDFGAHVALIGGLTGFGGEVPFFVLFNKNASVTSFQVGSRADFETMNRFLVGHQIHPIVDRVFEFEDAVEAFDFFMNGDFMGKVVIRH
jgi:NADPH:quinone reductase-like Zn-dependent oxidoreductase